MLAIQYELNCQCGETKEVSHKAFIKHIDKRTETGGVIEYVCKKCKAVSDPVLSLAWCQVCDEPIRRGFKTFEASKIAMDAAGYDDWNTCDKCKTKSFVEDG